MAKREAKAAPLSTAKKNIDSRRKGADFERRIARFLSERLGTTVERNLGQSRRAGTDLVSAPGAPISLDKWAIECKVKNKSSIPSWWRQARDNAKTNQKPVLVYKLRGMKPVWVFRTCDVPRGLPTVPIRFFSVDHINLVEFAEGTATEVLKHG